MSTHRSINLFILGKGRRHENEKDIISAIKSYLRETVKRRPTVFVTISYGVSQMAWSPVSLIEKLKD